MKKRKKRTPEEITHERQWRAESEANLRRLRELVDRGWAMHVDEYPRPLIRGLWPWGMRSHVRDYLQDLYEVTHLAASGRLVGQAEAAY